MTHKESMLEYLAHLRNRAQGAYLMAQKGDFSNIDAVSEEYHRIADEWFEGYGWVCKAAQERRNAKKNISQAV